MNAQRNHNPFYPEVYRKYLQKKAPTKDQTAKNLLSIANLDLNSDWSVYHAMIAALLNQSHVVVKESFDMDATEVFNAGYVSYDAAIKFLETHTDTYHAVEVEPTKEEIRDYHYDINQNFYANIGQL